MPTVIRVGRFRFFFYSNDRAEPPHIHVEAGNAVAKFWLYPVRLAGSRGMAPHELSRDPTTCGGPSRHSREGMACVLRRLRPAFRRRSEPEC